MNTFPSAQWHLDCFRGNATRDERRALLNYGSLLARADARLEKLPRLPAEFHGVASALQRAALWSIILAGK